MKANEIVLATAVMDKYGVLTPQKVIDGMTPLKDYIIYDGEYYLTKNGVEIVKSYRLSGDERLLRDIFDH